MPKSTTDIRRKVRGLRAMAAENSGATGPERETAKRLADRLEGEYPSAFGEALQSPPSVTITFTFG